MPFDALAASAVRGEIARCLVGGRVQKTHFADEQSLVLEVYAQGQRRWLLATANAEAARCHLVSAAPARGTDRVTPFLLLVRKHVRDARLAGIDQPDLERVYYLRFTHRNESGLLREVTLVLELMGRRSNFVLVHEDGTILDSLRRVSAQTNPARPLVPRGRYVPPPTPDRLDPRLATSYFALEERLGAARPSERTLAQLLQANLAGLSPFLAEELSYRATGEHRVALPRALPSTALHHAAEELFAPLSTGAWQPTVVLSEGEPVDAAPYYPSHVEPAQLEPARSMSEAFERVHAAPRRPVRHGLVRAPLQAALADRRAQLERKLAALGRSLEGSERAAGLRVAGETILANVHAITLGQDRLVVGDQEIALDPTRSAVENAQQYFEEYTRARDAARIVPELLEETENELRYVAEMAAQVELAEDAGTIEQLRRELVAAELLAPNRGEAKRGRPAPARGGTRQVQLDGHEVLIGLSAEGNARVTFDLSGPEDLWLHARGVPGSHVIVRTGGRPPEPRLLERAARLAARHSTARDEATVLVDWTPRKHVRKIKGAPPGLVTYTHEQTLRVRPQEP
jgi:predicted ribosome quality control (RQC) complex YloA/Tae2 family protein